MGRVAPRVPELGEILCSQCGYVLTGIAESGRCPECGKPIIDSIGTERTPPSWESTGKQQGRRETLRRLVFTSAEVILHPARFYRTLTVWGPVPPARRFARWQWTIASLLFGIAGAVHSVWYTYYAAPTMPSFYGGAWGLFVAMVFGLTVLTYLFLDWITRLAAWLTNKEATYRGLRLPYPVVLRGMYFHAAHYLPVAIGAVVTVVGYQALLYTAVRWPWLDRVMGYNSPTIYLYVLSAQVVVSAIYLFNTYWIGMRNMMYANR
jgi:hypothetical protein